MSFFKGFGELYVKTGGTSGARSASPLTGLAIVQEIILSDSNSPADVGKIRIKPIDSTNRGPDDELELYAYPADRRSISYPLPGEQVFIFVAISDEVDDKGKATQSLYYTTNLTQNNSITYNVLPNIGNRISEPNNLSKKIANFTQTLLKKFNSKLSSIDSFVNSNSKNGVEGVEVKERPSLQPYQGDVIHQGRFGQSIRFGSTSGGADDPSPWSKEGLPGNPITILRVHDQIVDGDVTYVTEDINKDNSSIYLASTQNIPLKLNCGTKMLSWQTTYKLEQPSSDAVKKANIATSKSTSAAAYLSADKIAADQAAAAGAIAEGLAGAATPIIQGGTWQAIAANYISKNEGFTPSAKWDENTYRGGYGSDKVVKNGVLTTVTSTTTFTKQEAIDTLRDYSIPKYSSQIIKDLGQANWDKLNDNQKAALVSLGYNVGAYFVGARSYGKKIKKYIESGNLKLAGETIFTDGPKSGAQSGYLPGLERRRREESQMFLTAV